MIQKTMKRFYIYTTVFGIAFVMLFIPVLIPISAGHADFRVFNTGWNGTSEFYMEYLTQNRPDIKQLAQNENTYLNTVLESITTLDIVPSNSILMMMGPSKSYSEDENAFLKNYVWKGGCLVLADDFGTGNEILSYLDIEERFSSKLMIDLVFEKSGIFPIAYRGEKEYSLILNYPSTIENSSDPIFFSTDLSFLDLNQNSIKDEDEASGPFPIASKIKFGDGEIYLISDPSIFINNMFSKLDNEAFIFNILSMAKEGKDKVLYVDESHFDIGQIKFVNIVLKAQNEKLFKYIVGSLLVVLFVSEAKIAYYLGMLMHQIPLKFRQKKEIKGLNRKELIDVLKEKHPEWNINALNNFFSKFE